MKLISKISRLKLLPSEEKELLALLKERDNLLKRCGKLSGTRRVRFAEQIVLKSKPLRVCAAIRVVPDQSTFNDVMKLASRIKLSRASLEVVKKVLRPKEGHGLQFRTISKPGVLRRARQLLVRDVLEVIGLDNNLDYTTRGGERALLNDITEAIEDRGHNWVGSIDIKDCYPSVGPKHLIDALPSREIAKECIRLSTTSADSLSPSASNPTTLSTNPPQNQVRPGLSQGSLISPLLARIVIAKVLDGCTVPAAARVFCFVDNIYITAPSRKDCEAAMQAIQRGFADNQAGRMICHKRRVWNAFSRRAQVLGYVLEPARNNGRMHRKPGPERCRRYRQRLFAKISQILNVGQQYKIAEEYARCWFNAQVGWTKVPELSWDSALTCAYLFVDDIRCGIIEANGKFKSFPIISDPR